jgi:tagatose 6-phosphate kinase
MILTVTLNAAIDKRYVVDEFKPGSVNRVKECSYSAGGKGLNVARVAAISGEEVTATGFVGGHAGSYIIEALQEQGIKSDFVHIKGESRSCINIYDEATHTQTEFLEPGAAVSDDDKRQMLLKYEQLVKDSTIVAISGSVPKGVDAAFYIKMIEIAKQYDRKVILDTSGKLLEEAIKAKPYMIKPNTDEISLLTGRVMTTPEDYIAAAEVLQQSGIELVVISCGSKGAVVASFEGVYRATVPDVEVVNTVGCGDSMVAGFAVGLCRGMSMVDTIKLAGAISSANAMRIETGYYKPEDMQRLLPLIQVEKLK